MELEIINQNEKKTTSRGSIIAKIIKLELSLHFLIYNLFCDDVDIHSWNKIKRKMLITIKVWQSFILLIRFLRTVGSGVSQLKIKWQEMESYHWTSSIWQQSGSCHVEVFKWHTHSWALLLLILHFFCFYISWANSAFFCFYISSKMKLV